MTICPFRNSAMKNDAQCISNCALNMAGVCAIAVIASNLSKPDHDQLDPDQTDPDKKNPKKKVKRSK